MLKRSISSAERLAIAAVYTGEDDNERQPAPRPARWPWPYLPHTFRRYCFNFGPRASKIPLGRGVLLVAVVESYRKIRTNILLLAIDSSPSGRLRLDPRKQPKPLTKQLHSEGRVDGTWGIPFYRDPREPFCCSPVRAGKWKWTYFCGVRQVFHWNRYQTDV